MKGRRRRLKRQRRKHGPPVRTPVIYLSYNRLVTVADQLRNSVVWVLRPSIWGPSVRGVGRRSFPDGTIFRVRGFRYRKVQFRVTEGILLEQPRP